MKASLKASKQTKIQQKQDSERQNFPFRVSESKRTNPKAGAWSESRARTAHHTSPLLLVRVTNWWYWDDCLRVLVSRASRTIPGETARQPQLVEPTLTC